jgi:polar amino acid transport system substrate-binding protein
MQKIQATHELHIGYLVFSPTVIRDPNNGKLSGFFIDMVEFMAKNLNAKVIYHETTLKDFSAGLNTRQFDLSICATYRTIARAEAVAFTQPIFYLGNGAVVRKDAADKFNKNTDFNNGNVHIAVLQGQAIHEYARVNFPKAKLIVLASGDLTAPLLEVSVGRADVGFCNYLDAERYAAAHPEVVDIFKDNPIEMVPLGWAVRSDDLVWLNFVNTAIDYMESTGRIGAWEKSYGTPLLHEKKSIELR